MATATMCRGCKALHDPLLTCSRAARLAQVAAAPAVSVTKPRRSKPVPNASDMPKPITDASDPITDIVSRAAKNQATYRQRKGDAGKAADAQRKRQARATKKAA